MKKTEIRNILKASLKNLDERLAAKKIKQKEHSAACTLSNLKAKLRKQST